MEGLILLFAAVGIFIHWITGALAARKGYNFLLWFFAGGGMISLIVLAFLPFTNKGQFSKDVAEQKRLKGNIIGGILAALSILNALRMLSAR